LKDGNGQMLSAEDSRARTSATQELEQESMDLEADSGQRWLGLSLSYDQSTSSWRTSQRCLTGEWEEYSETWPQSGMTQSGTAYPLLPLVRRISADESSLWHTPTATDAWAGSLEPRKCKGWEKGRGWTLGQQVRFRTWPTPTARDWKDGRKPYERKKNGEATQDTLGRVLAASGETANGLLNPTWVEWLMGFPIEWTALNHSETQ
jgi:hypothetical protein